MQYITTQNITTAARAAIVRGDLQACAGPGRGCSYQVIGSANDDIERRCAIGWALSDETIDMLANDDELEADIVKLHQETNAVVRVEDVEVARFAQSIHDSIINGDTPQKYFRNLQDSRPSLAKRLSDALPILTGEREQLTIAHLDRAYEVIGKWDAEVKAAAA